MWSITLCTCFRELTTTVFQRPYVHQMVVDYKAGGYSFEDGGRDIWLLSQVAMMLQGRFISFSHSA